MAAGVLKQARRSYLDFNATAPLRPDAREACRAALDLVGNPSSIHAEGRAARAIVEQARAAVAELAGVSPRGVTFTASGTEAANLALTPAIAAPGRAPPARLIASAGEHSCVLKGHRFAPAAVERAPLRDDGRIDLDALARMVGKIDGPVMLALQGANNETGVIQPVAEAAALVHAAGGIVVCDAVQLAGRAPIAAAELGADFLVLSAHKFGGPKGAGALIAASAQVGLPEPLLRGGGQERGLRAGTENVAAIAGFGAAARTATTEIAGEATRLAKLRDALAAHVLHVAPDAVIFGAGAPRLPNTLCFSASGISARDPGHRAGSGGRRRLVRRGLLVGQGCALARAGGDAGRFRTRRRRDKAEPRLVVRRGGRRAFRGGVRADRGEDQAGQERGVTR